MAQDRRDDNSAPAHGAASDELTRVLRAVGDRSLEEAEGDRWGPAPADATSLMAAVHRLRTVPIVELDPDDLRLLIGQRDGLDILVPVALRVIRSEPLVEATYYPGDLLVAVLTAPAAWFAEHPDVALALDQIVGAIDLTSSDEYGLARASPHVVDTIADWQQQRSTG